VDLSTPGDIEVVLDAHAHVGEGPTWDAEAYKLIWIDIVGNIVHRYNPTTGEDESIDVGQPVGAAAPRAAGGIVLALRDGFGILDIASGDVQMIAHTEADNPGNRMNDGACDSAGRFWAGTMSFDVEPGAGALYRLDTDHRVTKVLGCVTISNGLGWSLDDAKMYYIDSPTQGVDVFDYDPSSGQVENRRRLIDIPEQVGLPDGMMVDAEGFLWVALFGGGAVHRYSAEGRLDRVIDLPASQITKCVFGGEDLSDLYITSAAYKLSKKELEDQPHAGALFRCRPGPRGRPSYSFRG